MWVYCQIFCQENYAFQSFWLSINTYAFCFSFHFLTFLLLAVSVINLNVPLSLVTPMWPLCPCWPSFSRITASLFYQNLSVCLSLSMPMSNVYTPLPYLAVNDWSPPSLTCCASSSRITALSRAMCISERRLLCSSTASTRRKSSRRKGDSRRIL